MQKSALEMAKEIGNGSRVRVMQTDAMVAAGLANKVGVVFSVWYEGDRLMCRVQQVGGPFEGPDFGAMTVPAHSLMFEK